MTRLFLRGAAAAAVAVALTASPAFAGAADYADPDVEGSLLDHRNTTTATLSDAASTGAVVTLNGCTMGAERPRSHPSTTSPTRREVRSQVYLYCAFANNAQATFAMERVRWYGWERLVSITLTTSGVATVATGTLSTACRAGTWHYRVSGSNGTSSFHTSSTRETCARPDDLFAIEG